MSFPARSRPATSLPGARASGPPAARVARTGGCAFERMLGRFPCPAVVLRTATVCCSSGQPGGAGGVFQRGFPPPSGFRGLR